MSNWEGIDEFVAVAETGHFTGAATRLGVSMPVSGIVQACFSLPLKAKI